MFVVLNVALGFLLVGCECLACFWHLCCLCILFSIVCLCMFVYLYVLFPFVDMFVLSEFLSCVCLFFWFVFCELGLWCCLLKIMEKHSVKTIQNQKCRFNL